MKSACWHEQGTHEARGWSTLILRDLLVWKNRTSWFISFCCDESSGCAYSHTCDVSQVLNPKAEETPVLFCFSL